MVGECVGEDNLFFLRPEKSRLPRLSFGKPRNDKSRGVFHKKESVRLLKESHVFTTNENPLSF
jgi:hypothetical protein